MPDRWDRQPTEPARWYDRFTLYRDAGPGRSLAAIHAMTGGKVVDVPAVWYDAFERWHWRERATAWDTAQRERARQERIAVMKAVRGKALAELQAMKATDEQWGTVMSTLATTTRMLRSEGA